MNSPSSEIAFISGPIDTGRDSVYFHTHYAPRIAAAIKRGDQFVIGPIPSGVDTDALAYLLEYPVSSDRITVFVTTAEDQLWGKKFGELGVRVHVQGETTAQRDAAMTQASTYDILRWRKKDEAKEFYGTMWREGHLTNTERNWRRRRGIALDAVVREDEVDFDFD